MGIAFGYRRTAGDGDDEFWVTLCDAEQRVISLARKRGADETAASTARSRGVEGGPESRDLFRGVGFR